MTSKEPTYVGRFAPTPSGPLHFGSLYTAVASFLDARAHNGKWLLRIDNIDQPRVVPSSEQEITESLLRHGLAWDDDIIRQHDQVPEFLRRLSQLIETDNVFYCTCTRRILEPGKPYPGTCRDRRERPEAPHSTRVRVTKASISFHDLLQGNLQENLTQLVGDFIVVRRDQIVSYPLAAAVSDSMNGISVVVRGADLLTNTFNQLFLQDLLRLRRPQYLHLPVLCERGNVKLSKRDRSVAVDNVFAIQNLECVLQMLGLDPPSCTSVEQVLDWGIEHWNRDSLPNGNELTKFVSI